MEIPGVQREGLLPLVSLDVALVRHTHWESLVLPLGLEHWAAQVTPISCLMANALVIELGKVCCTFDKTVRLIFPLLIFFPIFNCARGDFQLKDSLLHHF